MGSDSATLDAVLGRDSRAHNPSRIIAPHSVFQPRGHTEKRVCTRIRFHHELRGGSKYGPHAFRMGTAIREMGASYEVGRKTLTAHEQPLTP